MKRLKDNSDVPEADWRRSHGIWATFYFRAEEWVLPAASAKEPEEREFVVDSGASMHMVSKKDLNSAELETMRTSRSPTAVITAKGEVQTREEATKNVKELHIFVTVMLLEETFAVLSLGKLCEDHVRQHRTDRQVWTKNGGRIPWNVTAICETFKILRRSEIPFNGQSIPFGAMVEYHPVSSKDQSRIHQFGKKVLPGIWKVDIMVADIEELETMDASEIYSKRLN